VNLDRELRQLLDSAADGIEPAPGPQRIGRRCARRRWLIQVAVAIAIGAVLAYPAAVAIGGWLSW
jgi:hypothetical protein